jgi:hypothetical protein
MACWIRKGSRTVWQSALTFDAPGRNGRATGRLARPGRRPGRWLLVPWAGPKKFLDFLAVHSVALCWQA